MFLMQPYGLNDNTTVKLAEEISNIHDGIHLERKSLSNKD